MAINTTLSDVHSNDLLGANRTEAQSTYENCMYNLYKFLDSAVEFTDQILTMQIAEAEAKAKLALEGINIFAVTPEPTPTFVKTDDNSSATAEAEGAISNSINQQAADGVTYNASNATHGGSGGSLGTSTVPINYYGTDTSKVPLGALAKRAAEIIGSSHPELIWAQMMLETGGPSYWEDDPWTLECHNYGGITWESWMEGMPGVHIGPPRTAAEGGNYVRFDSDEDYIRMYCNTLKKCEGLNRANTPEEYAQILKDNEYYESSTANYISSMYGWLEQYSEQLKGGL